MLRFLSFPHSSIASSLEGITSVPAGCSGMQLFHCIDPALLSVLPARQIPRSLCDYRTAEFPMQQLEQSNISSTFSNTKFT